MSDEDDHLIEEFHLSVLVPRDWADERVKAVRREINRKAFRRRLKRSLTRLLRRVTAADDLRVRVSR